MKQISIFRDGVLTNQGQFETDELLNAWFESHKEMGSFGSDFTYEIVDLTEQIQKESTNQEFLKYLADTDWYVIRNLETGVEMPEDIKNLREQARTMIQR